MLRASNIFDLVEELFDYKEILDKDNGKVNAPHEVSQKVL